MIILSLLYILKGERWAGRMDEWMHGQMISQMDEWIYRLMDSWMNGQMG